MPDMQTALQTALKQWEEPKETTVQTSARIPGPPRFAVTNNVSRATFEHVRDNPESNNQAICEALAQRGYKRGSVSSLLGQMVIAGLLARTDGRYRAIAPEYVPFSAATLRAKRKPVSKTEQEAERAQPAQPAPQPRAVPSVDELVDTLTVAQARDLFDRLKKMFA